MSEILEITKALVDFRDERDWKQFHDTKNLALAFELTSFLQSLHIIKAMFIFFYKYKQFHFKIDNDH